jgi:GntR family transcriptional regulator
MPGPQKPIGQLDQDTVMLYYNSMRVRLIPSSGVSIYRQIVDQIGDQIACGRLQPGDRLPSVRELARALPANQNTVIKAYEVLERDGLITRRHGDGTFVANSGSSLSVDDRRRIVVDLLGHAALKAQLFEITPDELHQLLKQQIASLPQQKEDAHG